ncbi:hypothetical protein [Corallococcus exercitus]|uniref:hypothetical protein n=1 Tax=Corallococcus exercitus TaxID=2316736 RepID=UPI0035D3DD00
MIAPATAATSKAYNKTKIQTKSAKKAKRFDVCSVQTIGAPLNTSALFSLTTTNPEKSALDEFLVATQKLNLLLKPKPDHDPLLGHLVLLGYMSAVESYFRTLIRRIITIDDAAQKCVHTREIAYAAAMHHRDPSLLPEALFEGTTFVSKHSISESLKDFLGIKGHTPPDLEATLDEYSKVCQIRHCLVHRFGKLGSKNAIALGLSAHGPFLEKPISVGYDELQSAFAVLYQTVKVVNNHVFNSVISRIPDWHRDLRRDRSRFKRYYSIFATVSDVPPSPSLRECYDALIRNPGV